MKFSRLICCILCLLLLMGSFPAAKCAETDAAVANGCHGIDAAIAIGGEERLTESATAAIIYERSSGTMVYAMNPDKRIYPSSMVKLMTVIVALEFGDLDDQVTVTRSALNAMGIGVVSVELEKDERISLRDLLYCVMVHSANDASTVVAEHIGGSQEGFVALMNEKAEQIGCKDTNFTNAHGLHDENCYTTARDVLRILEYGLQIEEFKIMFETKTYTLTRPDADPDAPRQIYTTNHMMSKEKTRAYYDSRVTGGKTGSTNAAGRCLAVTAQIGDMELIGIVMGATPTYSEDGLSVERYGSFEEMSELLNHIQNGYERRQLYYAGQVIAQYSVENGGNNVVAMPNVDGFCVLPKGTAADALIWKYESQISGLSAPLNAGTRITNMEVWYGDVCLCTTELVAMYCVEVHVPYEEPKSATDMKEEESHGDLLALILGVLLGVVLAAGLGLFLLRLVRTMILRARIRKRRKNRRRNRNAALE